MTKCTAAATLFILCPQLLVFPYAFAADTTSPLGVPSLKDSDPVELTPAQLNQMLKEMPIPHLPSAPPQLFERTAPDTFRCQRFFVYQGKTLGCDSSLHADAERLRPVFSQVPEAIAYLDSYQSTQRWLTSTAYIGSAGLVLLLAGLLGGGGNGKKIMYLGGGGLFLGSIVYGVTAIHANEGKLGDAIEAYNRAKPGDPIQLQFNTGIVF